MKNEITEPSPAEVKPATGDDLAIYNRIAANYQAARVEGELTDDEIRQVIFDNGYCRYNDDGDHIQFARAIERALNQRLAVKEGVQLVEIESHPVVIEDKATFATLTDIQMALSKAGCPFVTEDGKLMSAVEQIQWLSTNPVDGNGGQQAKDAARECERISNEAPEFQRPNGYSCAKAIRALSATKQEEV